MSNIDAVNQAPLGIQPAPTPSKLIGQKANPWFNVLAAVVIVAGVIYTGIHLADDLSVVRDTRAYPYILLGIALMIARTYTTDKHVTAAIVAFLLVGIVVGIPYQIWIKRRAAAAA